MCTRTNQVVLRNWCHCLLEHFLLISILKKQFWNTGDFFHVVPQWPAGPLRSNHYNYYKVNRCLARYRPHATSQLINRAPNEPAMIRNANFGLNLVIFGQKILFFTGEIKSFVTHITETPPRHLVCIGFWSGTGRNGQKMPISDQKWPKMQILDQIWPFLGQNPNSFTS